MRLDDLDPSQNVRDLGQGGGGGGGGFPLLGLLPLLFSGRMGCGGFAILAIIAGVYLFGGGLGQIASPGPAVQQGQVGSRTAGGGGRDACVGEERLFACRVLVTTETTWTDIFRQSGQRYQPTTLYFFQGGARSGCGQASSAMGPFYCPSDQGVYLDTSFFQELSGRFGASGDFAQAYVIAHEVGHHIQQLTGTSSRVQDEMRRVSSAEGNALSVRLELQADCYAGVWGARNRDRLEPGDIEEGLTAANAIGDDTLQRESQGRVVPDSFTHGTSAQRIKWLRVGLQSGDPARCDTFTGAI